MNKKYDMKDDGEYVDTHSAIHNGEEGVWRWFPRGTKPVDGVEDEVERLRQELARRTQASAERTQLDGAELHQAKAEWAEEKKRAREAEEELEATRDDIHTALIHLQNRNYGLAEEWLRRGQQSHAGPIAAYNGRMES